MTFNDIEAAIGQHLADMPNAPRIAWPNKADDGTVPYLEFRHAPNTIIDDSLKGGCERQIGLVLINIVTDRDAFSTQANDIAQNIKDRFPKALKLAAGSGKVVIQEPTSLGTPFADSTHWRQPVRVSYITE